MKNLLAKFTGILLGSLTVVVMIPEIALALSSREVGQIAQKITVLIERPRSAGSGIIVEKKGNRYLILTAEHVIRNLQSNEPVFIVTHDEERYQLDPNSIKTMPGVDLALVEMVSQKSYPQVVIGNSQNITAGTTVYVSGFPIVTAAITRPLYNFTDGRVTANANKPMADGYALVYSNNTLPGMSGGPVLDEEGRLVAIHGKGDTTGTAETQNKNVRIKTGFNLGIPVTTYLGWLGKSVPTTEPVNSGPTADDFFLQGVAKYERGDFSGAITSYTEALKINTKYADAYNGRGMAHANLEQLSRAIADYNQAIRLNPRLALPYNNRGNAQAELGKWSEAIADYSKTIELNPQIAQAYNNRGNALSEIGKYRQALTDYNQGIKLNPNIPDTYYNRGLVRFFLNDPQGAMSDYERAISLNGDFWQARNNLGLLQYETGATQEAMQQWQKASNLAKLELEPQFALAVALHAKGQTQKGIAKAEAVLNIDARYRNLEFLRSNLWGDRLITDANKLLQSPPFQPRRERKPRIEPIVPPSVTPTPAPEPETPSEPAPSTPTQPPLW